MLVSPPGRNPGHLQEESGVASDTVRAGLHDRICTMERDEPHDESSEESDYLNTEIGFIVGTDNEDIDDDEE